MGLAGDAAASTSSCTNAASAVRLPLLAGSSLATTGEGATASAFLLVVSYLATMSVEQHDGDVIVR